MGSTQADDILVFDEAKNSNFRVAVENTLSGEFILLSIESTFKPRCNEIWVKSAKEVDSKFKLVQPLRERVSYYIKHSGDFLYKVSNEDDGYNYKISRFLVPSSIKTLLVEPGTVSNVDNNDES